MVDAVGESLREDSESQCQPQTPRQSRSGIGNVGVCNDLLGVQRSTSR